jgi:DNA transformation protein and related proteins
MANSDATIAHILDLLSDWGGVSARRMFSGHGLHKQGVMFGLIIADTLYFKTDERNRGEYLEAGSAPFSFKKGGKLIETSYLEAPPELFDEPEEMCRWAADALDVALRAQKAKAPKRKPAAGKKRKPANITKI